MFCIPHESILSTLPCFSDSILELDGDSGSCMSFILRLFHDDMTYLIANMAPSLICGGISREIFVNFFVVITITLRLTSVEMQYFPE